MNEVIVRYKNRKTLKALAALGEYLGFTIADSEYKGKKETYHINGITVESGDSSIDIHELNEVFTGKNIEAETLRKSAWQRKG